MQRPSCTKSRVARCIFRATHCLCYWDGFDTCVCKSPGALVKVSTKTLKGSCVQIPAYVSSVVKIAHGNVCHPANSIFFLGLLLMPGLGKRGTLCVMHCNIVLSELNRMDCTDAPSMIASTHTHGNKAANIVHVDTHILGSAAFVHSLSCVFVAHCI